MSGADIIPSVSDRPRRSVHLPNENDLHSPDVEIVSPLDEFAHLFRATRNGHPFASLALKYRSELYDRAADVWLRNKSTGFTYLMAAEQIAHLYNITFADCDRSKIKMAISKRVQAKKQYQNVVGDLIDEVTPEKVVRVDVIVNKRRGHVRPPSIVADHALKSNKLRSATTAPRTMWSINRCASPMPQNFHFLSAIPACR